MTLTELREEFDKYMDDSIDYYTTKEPLTDRKLLQMWLDCALPREEKISNLEKENTELKKNKEVAKELLKWFVWYFREGRPNLVPYKDKLVEVEQFLRLIECQ